MDKKYLAEVIQEAVKEGRDDAHATLTNWRGLSMEEKKGYTATALLSMLCRRAITLTDFLTARKSIGFAEEPDYHRYALDLQEYIADGTPHWRRGHEPYEKAYADGLITEKMFRTLVNMRGAW